MQVNLNNLGPKLTALDGELTTPFDGLANEVPTGLPDAEDWPDVRAGVIEAGQRVSEQAKAKIRATFAPVL